ESAMVYDPDKEDVYPSGPLGQLELSILYQVLSVNVYAEILRTLGTGGYTDQLVKDPLSPLYAEDHYSCFTFFYDWRRDNVENAIRLGYFIEERRKEVDKAAQAKVDRLRASGKPEELEEADAIASWLEEGYNFDIVAHSMGGLIARYYMRYGKTDLPADGSLPELTWEGAANVDRLVMVGTPNLGSMDAMRNLQHGFKPAWLLPRFGAAILGSMPALYQLLPRVRHQLLVDGRDEKVELDFLDPEVWKENEWGLMSGDAGQLLSYLLPELDSEEARRDQAYEYLTWCLARARGFHASLDRPVEEMPATEVFLFAGDAENTLIKAKQEHWGGLSFEERRLYGDGDGTVARY
ncbi:MAG: lipase family alpha/beta hydrolase, partial [Planctomycetota bacterium]